MDPAMKYYKVAFDFQIEEGLNSTQMNPAKVKRVT
jgi:hypothetical protein